MKEYITKNYKTYLSIILSLIIVLFVIPIFATPGRLTNLISKIRFPNLNFDQFDQTKGQSRLTPTTNVINSVNFYQTSPIPTPLRPTGYAGQAPTNRLNPILSPTNGTDVINHVSTPTITKTPTKYIKPTKIPKPTKTPDVFPIDPSLVRPGKTSNEVFKIASQKTCVPEAVLKSIAYIESGEFFSVVSPKYFLLYNSYNWWNSPYLTEEKRACGGYDFANATGIIPSDSKFAGYNCHSDGSTSSEYNTIMGPMQMTIAIQNKFAKNAASALGVKQVDRRVILDALLLAGFNIKYNVRASSCVSWSGREVAKAACSYYGSCNNGYCTTFCNNYRKFGGKGGCDAGAFTTNCWN